jgi:hypothetical protein
MFLGQKLSRGDFDYPTRVLCGIAIVLSAALLSNLQLLKDAAILRNGNLVGVDMRNYEKRWMPLRLYLPAQGVVGYMSGLRPDVLDNEDADYDEIQKEYQLAQYILAPVILRPAGNDAIRDFSFIIINEYGSGFAGSKPRIKIAPPEGFALVRDFGNGLLLYRAGL